MPTTTNSSADIENAPSAENEMGDSDLVIEKNHTRNLLTMAWYQIVMRTGWIFKTESVVMPAFLDAIGGAGWLRGCLPAINRFGQSVPPLLFSRRLKILPQKKRAVFGFTLMMATAFFVLSAIYWQTGTINPEMFLAIYAVFFICTGLNQLAFGTLQGKLIRANRRGRLMLIANITGSVTAVAAAWYLMGWWMDLPSPAFHLSFGFAGVCFLLSAVAMWRIVEPADDYQEEPVSILDRFRGVGQTLRDDKHFRKVAILSVMFGVVMVLFPHYQALGREKLGTGWSDLVLWVCVQNTGTGLFSVVIGPLADRRGNRLVLQVLMMFSALAPLTAIVAVHSPPEYSKIIFAGVFVLVGLTPITIKSLINYTLEISPTADHPRYLSTLSICFALPIFFSPLVGALIDQIGFTIVMLSGAGVLVFGFLYSSRLIEPRVHTDFNTPETNLMSDE